MNEICFHMRYPVYSGFFWYQKMVQVSHEGKTLVVCISLPHFASQPHVNLLVSLFLCPHQGHQQLPLLHLTIYHLLMEAPCTCPDSKITCSVSSTDGFCLKLSLCGLFVELVQYLLCHLAVCNQVEHREIETFGSNIASICR